jgi:hypothetical protein
MDALPIGSEAEDALTRTLDDGKDVLLGKLRRRVEDGGPPSRPGAYTPSSWRT